MDSFFWDKFYSYFPTKAQNDCIYQVFEENGKYGIGILDRDDNYNWKDKITKAEFDFKPLWHCKFMTGFVVVKDGVAGFMDLEGTLLIPYKFDNFGTYMHDLNHDTDRTGHDQYIITKYKNQIGLVDRWYFKEVIPLGDYYSISWNNITSKNFFIIQNIDRLYGFYDLENEKIIPCQYKKFKLFWEAHQIFKIIKNNKEGLLVHRINGGIVILVECKYDSIEIFNENEAIYKVSDNEKYGLISRLNTLIQCKYDYISVPKDGISKVILDNKIGYITITGEVIIEPQFNEGSMFVNGLAKVFQNEKVGYINTKGVVVIPFLYFQGHDFENNLARVSKKVQFKKNFFIFSKTTIIEKFGIINDKGITVIPFEYDKIDNFQDGKAKVIKEGRNGYIDINGNEFW